MQERAERSVNIGDDSLPGPWNLISPSAPKQRKSNKTGGAYRFLLRAAKRNVACQAYFIAELFGLAV
jgi:hypothetical protein